MTELAIRCECFPMRGRFTISRGSRTEAEVVVVELAEGGAVGRGECVPYSRYGETGESVAAQIEQQRAALARGLDRAGLQRALPAGAARNALDCALWDLEAKRSGKPVWQLAGLPEPVPLATAYTLSLGTPEAMGDAARKNAERPLLKIKLGGDGDLARLEAVRAGAPDARLIVDANEAWTPALLPRFLPEMGHLGVSLVEQPLPAGRDQALAHVERGVPVCADESCHVAADIAALVGRYDYVNIKLDKTGGLTEAIRCVEAARAAGLGIMVGCMVGTSLAMAPATLLGFAARFVDLDGPLLLAEDRPHGLAYKGSQVQPASPALWG